MEQLDDSALLRRYAQEQSDDAFAAVVTRHINLVYSVALRQTGSAENAEEITQVVFIILARKAEQLRHDKALSSWLFETTRLTGNNFLRSEMRRRNREQEAYMQSVLNEPEDDLWQKLAPLLDNAVASLREKDRQVILLRFYEQKNLRDVGNALGTGEDAAEKRVSRALEKLRSFFAKRGVNSTAAVISEKISMHSVQAAPAMLAKTVTLAAAAKGAAASASTLTLVKGAMKIMAWTKTKTTVVAAVVMLAAVGTTVILTPDVLPGPDIQGTWVGTERLGGYGVQAGESPKTRVVMRVTRTNGSYQATGDSIDQGVRDVPSEVFTYKHRRVHTEISESHSSFDGTVNLAGTKITGKWKDNANNSGSIEFVRTAEPPPFPEPLTDDEFARRAGSDLQGFWKGEIGTGKHPLEVNIKIAEPSGGTFRADFYCPPQGGARQPTSVSYDGTRVKLMTMAGYGMFEGELRNGGKEMVGNWIQNGRHTPTTFALAN